MAEKLDSVPEPIAAEATSPLEPSAPAKPKSTLSLASPHRFSREAQELTIEFKKLLEETEADGWVSLGVSKDVQITNKPIEGSSLGILKGVLTIEGFTTREVYPVTQLPGCRKIWDDLLESSAGLEVLDKTCMLSYASTKPQGFVSSRDMVVILVNEFVEDGRIYSMGKSVVDPKHPEVKGKVRAKTTVGWYLEPLPDRVGTKLTNITLIDLGGWIPGNVLKLAATQIPLVVAAVRKYLKVHGAIGFPVMLGGSVTSTPEFDHASSKMDIEFEIVNAISPFTEIAVPKTRYPSGANITVSGAEGLEYEVNEKGNVVVKHGKDELNGKVVKISLVKKSSGPFSLSVNGTKLFPAGDEAPSTATSSIPTTGSSVASHSSEASVGGASGSSFQELQDEIMRRLDNIERQLANPPRANSPEKLGTIILLAAPIAALVLARVFG